MRMRIGIAPILNPSAGGAYQYSLTMLRTLNQWQSQGCQDNFVIFTREIHHPAVMSLNGRSWDVKPMQPPSVKHQALDVLRKIVGEGPLRKVWRWVHKQLEGKGKVPELNKVPNPDVVRFRPEMRSWFKRCGVELMLYPGPNSLSYETGIPYVMAIHDLQQRLQPEFPEVSASGMWEWREYLFRNGTRYATLLLADSDVGKEDILNFYGAYGITPDRVKVLPFLPACYLALDISDSEMKRVRKIYHLPEPYLFYPAQFWPHKNHTRIVQALSLLKKEYRIKIPIVFCGSYIYDIQKVTFHNLMLLSRQLGLDEEVHYLGYVPEEDMTGLYAGALALVMPTFFGPTNIPVLEAWALGCPVLTSDIRGIREQAGDAALLVDPRSVEAIADDIYRLWTNENLRRTLADRGRQQLRSYTPDDFRNRLIQILEEAKLRVRSEKPRSTMR